MNLLTSRTFYISLLVILMVISPETEARRKILKGRKTMTRTYYQSSIIPSWLLVLVVGITELGFGGLLYLLLKFCILDKVPQAVKYEAAPTSV